MVCLICRVHTITVISVFCSADTGRTAASHHWVSHRHSSVSCKSFVMGEGLHTNYLLLTALAASSLRWV
jgi:hypothetical protein